MCSIREETEIRKRQFPVNKTEKYGYSKGGTDGISLFYSVKGEMREKKRNGSLFADYLAGVVYGKNKNFFQSEGK